MLHQYRKDFSLAFEVQVAHRRVLLRALLHLLLPRCSCWRPRLGQSDSASQNVYRKLRLEKWNRFGGSGQIL
uniref:Transposase n=1 Tax=Peronospora matthiolae TaxID=2874970 RepID=A0AAV1TUT7_9STRA